MLRHPGWKMLALLMALVGLSGCDKIRDLPVGNAYTAKHLCSGIFNTGLDPALVRDQFIAPKVQPLPFFWNIDIDEQQKIVTVGDVVFGSRFAATAVHRDNIGCTLLSEQKIPGALDIALTRVAPVPVEPLPDEPWPYGRGGLANPLPANIDYAQLQAAVASAFTENRDGPRNTTSLLVVHRGQLIAEQYALGVTAESPVLGWSMTKTVTAMLIGLLVDQGVLDLQQTSLFPEWQNDERASIRLVDILQMASGLKFNEDYLGLSDASAMLNLKADMAAFARAKPLAATPGTRFNYATGDTLMLSKLVRDAAGGDLQSSYDFYQRSLFHKLDIHSAFIEFDASGTFVGGAYGYMTPRDWARLGLFYLNGGRWKDQQILSPQWMEFALTPSPSADFYAAQLWINSNGFEWPGLPSQLYHFNGHQGQLVLILPEHDLVIVRTGVTEDEGNVGEEEFVNGILAALP